MSEKIWSDDAWADYLYWHSQDKKTLKRINMLIQDIERNGAMKGIGDPEALKGNLQGEYSRRINEKDDPAFGQRQNPPGIKHQKIRPRERPDQTL